MAEVLLRELSHPVPVKLTWTLLPTARSKEFNPDTVQFPAELTTTPAPTSDSSTYTFSVTG